MVHVVPFPVELQLYLGANMCSGYRVWSLGYERVSGLRVNYDVYNASCKHIIGVLARVIARVIGAFVTRSPKPKRASRLCVPDFRVLLVRTW